MESNESESLYYQFYCYSSNPDSLQNIEYCLQSLETGKTTIFLHIHNTLKGFCTKFKTQNFPKLQAKHQNT